MSNKKNIIAGALAVILAGGSFVAYDTNKELFVKEAVKPLVLVSGFIGGEKSGFMNDIKPILKSRYNIEVNDKKMGSIDMTNQTDNSSDFLWPSSGVVLDVYSEKGGKYLNQDIIFSSPLVFYSWNLISERMGGGGFITNEKGYAEINMQYMTDAISGNAKWKDIGVPELNGNVSIVSTDPTKSNSGNMLAVLFATSLNDGNTPSIKDIDNLGPKVNEIFDRLGYMDRTSSDTFKQFLLNGIGAYPIVALYESQIIEYYNSNPKEQELIENNVKILYPSPTVWANHVFISKTENGNRLMEALKDPEIQKIAQEKYGFRVSGGKNESETAQKLGLANQVMSVVPLPNSIVIEKMNEYIKQ